MKHAVYKVFKARHYKNRNICHKVSKSCLKENAGYFPARTLKRKLYMFVQSSTDHPIIGNCNIYTRFYNNCLNTNFLPSPVKPRTRNMLCTSVRLEIIKYTTSSVTRDFKNPLELETHFNVNDESMIN